MEIKCNNSGLKFSNNSDLVFFLGLNVLEDDINIINETVSEIKNISKNFGINFCFKASFDKANRSSKFSYRGIGIEKSLKTFDYIKSEFNVPIISDIHEKEQVEIFQDYIDIFQLPAFLARQTDLVEDLANSGKVINVKKPQFLSPYQVFNIYEKFKEFNNPNILICERGTSFGYDNLVVDFIGFDVIKKMLNNIPIIFDVTHSLQIREIGSAQSGGRRGSTKTLASAAVATKIAGLFIETHPDVKMAKCDAESAYPLQNLASLVSHVLKIDKIVKNE